MTEEDGGTKSNNSLSANDFAGAGIQFAVALVLFVFLGSWLDKRFGTSPLFILLGVLVGGGGSFFVFCRKVVAAQKADDERRRKTTSNE
jgi:F0F1-type ATP synthase assembly protein I